MNALVIGIPWLVAYVVAVVGFLRDRWSGARTQAGLFLTVLGAVAVTAGWVAGDGASGFAEFALRASLIAGGILTIWGAVQGLGREPPRPRELVEVLTLPRRAIGADAGEDTDGDADRKIAELLKEFDAESGYGDQEIALRSDGDVFVVSDLHLASGRARDNSYVGTENFFADLPFARFLSRPRPPKPREDDAARKRDGADVLSDGCESPHNEPAGPGATLVINGDFVDFIRVMDVPKSDNDFRKWSELLEPLGIYRSPYDLKSAIVPTECKHGLRTTDYKSVWKLAVAIKGHEPVFEALAQWVGAGHRLVIVKGNHDVEWYWRAVRNYLRLRLASLGGRTPLAELPQILPNIVFVDHAVVFDEHLYIEHGHRFEELTRVIGAPLLEDRAELRLPFGSFINRYIINHVELGYPYIDNIRPKENIVPVLFRERFPTALRLLFNHAPLMLKTIPRGYYRYFLRRVLPFVVVLSVPAFVAATSFRDQIPDVVDSFQNLGTATRTDLVGQALGFLADGVRDLAWLVLSYIGTQLLAAFQLSGGHGLERHARLLFSQRPQLRHVVYGHTHDPRQAERNGCWFYNAGTWIPVIETSSASVRHDYTYTYLYMPSVDGSLQDGQLYRWYDEAGRSEPAPIMHRS